MYGRLFPHFSSYIVVSGYFDALAKLVIFTIKNIIIILHRLMSHATKNIVFITRHILTTFRHKYLGTYFLIVLRIVTNCVF